MDFGALPPEVNSGLMYAGPGSGPMITAAAAWDALAAELGTTASSYQTVIDGLTDGSWHGPSSAAMAGAAAPYVQWMSTSAAQAEQTASQARAAAAGYEAAFSATVPPPVIAANRSLLMTLIATNFLGQNTAAIAATEFHYAEMWAQDAAAMYGYAGSSAAATQLTPFTAPPQTANGGAVAAQSSAVAQATATSAGGNAQSTLSQLISAMPGMLQNLTSPVSTAAAPAQAESPLLAFLDAITGPTSPLSYFPIAGVPYLLGFQNILLPMAGENLAGALAKNSTLPISASGILGGELAGGTHALGAGSSVSAGLGQAGMVGKLSVPQAWASAAPAVRPVAFTLPSNGIGAAPAALAEGSESLFSQTALSGLAGRALAGTGGSVVRSAGVTSGVSIGGDAATTATIIVIPADE